MRYKKSSPKLFSLSLIIFGTFVSFLAMPSIIGGQMRPAPEPYTLLPSYTLYQHPAGAQSLRAQAARVHTRERLHTILMTSNFNLATQKIKAILKRYPLTLQALLIQGLLSQPDAHGTTIEKRILDTLIAAGPHQTSRVLTHEERSGREKLTFSQDGKYLGININNGIKVIQQEHDPVIFRTNGDPIDFFFADDKLICATETTLYLWDMGQPPTQLPVTQAVNGKITAIALNAKKGLLAILTSQEDEDIEESVSISIRRISGLQEVYHASFQDRDVMFYWNPLLTFTPEGNFLIAKITRNSRSFIQWHIGENDQVTKINPSVTLPKLIYQTARSLVFNPRENLLVSHNEDKMSFYLLPITLHRDNGLSARGNTRTLTVRKAEIRDVTFNPSATVVAMGGSSVSLWPINPALTDPLLDPKNPAKWVKFPFAATRTGRAYISAIVFTPNGSNLLALHNNGTLYNWKLRFRIEDVLLMYVIHQLDEMTTTLSTQMQRSQPQLNPIEVNQFWYKEITLHFRDILRQTNLPDPLKQGLLDEINEFRKTHNLPIFD